MTETVAKYRVLRRFSIVAHDANRVEFRHGVWNATSTTVSDDSGAGKLATTVRLLNGENSVASVAELTDQSVDDVSSVIDYLIDKGIVSREADNFLDEYLDVAQARRAPVRREFPRVLVVGSPRTAGALVAALDESLDGLEVVQADDNHPLRRVTHEDASWLNDGLEFHRSVREFAELEGSFVIYLEDVVDPVRTRVVDRVLDHYKVPWLYGAVDGPFVLVGPLTCPGRTPSWEAYETRTLLNLRESHSYQSYKQALAEGQVTDTGASVLPALSSLLTAHALPEALSWITTETAGTLGHVYSFFVPTSEFAVHEVLPLPDSRVGVPVPERDDFELYFGTRTLEGLAE